MVQTVSSLASKSSEQYSDGILCLYSNYTSQLQIAKMNNIQNCKFERVVFPGQRLLFEAVPEAQLEIYTGMMGKAYLADKINCSCLRVE